MTGFWSPAPVLVAGPCALEGDDRNLEIAGHLAELGTRLSVRVIFKASFDKANRSTVAAARGPGLEAGLQALDRVRSVTGVPVLTDVHEAWQVDRVAPCVDGIQIPAFLCRQTDLLMAAGASGCPVNIKKGQWMSPESMAGAVEKVQVAGGRNVAVTERGTAFGYGDLVVDMRSFERIRRVSAVPVLFDATHAVQQPGSRPDGGTGGSRKDIPALMRAAAAAGADGFFVETHPDPDRAPSDSATMWPLGDLEALLDSVCSIWHAARDRRGATANSGGM